MTLIVRRAGFCHYDDMMAQTTQEVSFEFRCSSGQGGLLMRVFLSGVVGVIVLLTVGMVQSQPPDWTLLQNDPNPFCNADSYTRIRYALAQESRVLLRVWSPDTSTVSRVLIDAVQSSGFYEVIWDGRDGAGYLLENGEYPYSLTATEVGGEIVLFERMLVSSVHCVPTAAGLDTWGTVKSLFR